jgi:hypothetical protein
VETGRNGVTVADITSVIGVGRVGKNIYELRSKILCSTLFKMHGEGLLDEGLMRIHVEDVMIAVNISHSVI